MWIPKGNPDCKDCVEGMKEREDYVCEDCFWKGIAERHGVKTS